MATEIKITRLRTAIQSRLGVWPWRISSTGFFAGMQLSLSRRDYIMWPTALSPVERSLADLEGCCRVGGDRLGHPTDEKLHGELPF